MSEEEDPKECEQCGKTNVKIYSDGLCLKCWGDEQVRKGMKEESEEVRTRSE